MNTATESHKENAEEILGFMPHGWKAVKALQAQCRLYQALPPVSREEIETIRQRMDDLTDVLAGMQAHLQTIHDVLDNVEGYAEDILGLRPPHPLPSSRKQSKAINE